MSWIDSTHVVDYAARIIWDKNGERLPKIIHSKKWLAKKNDGTLRLDLAAKSYDLTYGTASHAPMMIKRSYPGIRCYPDGRINLLATMAGLFNTRIGEIKHMFCGPCRNGENYKDGRVICAGCSSKLSIPCACGGYNMVDVTGKMECASCHHTTQLSLDKKPALRKSTAPNDSQGLLPTPRPERQIQVPIPQPSPETRERVGKAHMSRTERKRTRKVKKAAANK